MKKYEQMSKKSYLLTSPEKFQQEPGSGFSNTDSVTPTGKNIAVILKKTSDSFSQLENPQTSQSVGTSPQKLIPVQMYDKEKDLYYTIHVPQESGIATETHTRQPTSSERYRQSQVLSLLRTLFQHTK